jgi:hypothetical protein
MVKILTESKLLEAFFELIGHVIALDKYVGIQIT